MPADGLSAQQKTFKVQAEVTTFCICQRALLATELGEGLHKRFDHEFIWFCIFTV